MSLLRGQLVHTDENGNPFDAVQWQKITGQFGLQNELLGQILLELKKQTEILEDIQS